MLRRDHHQGLCPDVVLAQLEERKPSKLVAVGSNPTYDCLGACPSGPRGST